MNNLKDKSAILYRRVSTSDQKVFGNSLNAQQSSLKDFCLKNSITIIEEFQEDYSAKNFNRPEWKKLNKFAQQNRKKIDYLLVVDWDRFSRNTLDLLQVIEKFKRMKVSLHFTEFGEVTGSDAMGSVFVKLLSVLLNFTVNNVVRNNLQLNKD